MKINPGEIVGIQGLGGLGHLALQYAAKMGYRVVALSSSASKESFARDLGAHDYVDGSKTDQGEYLKKLGGAGLIVSTAPNPDVMGQLLAGLAPLGKLLILSGKSRPPQSIIHQLLKRGFISGGRRQNQ
jgi:D-arabinose 1-dehydrogenase-like Zn-dependent alcohol dehydrogenase